MFLWGTTPVVSRDDAVTCSCSVFHFHCLFCPNSFHYCSLHLSLAAVLVLVVGAVRWVMVDSVMFTCAGLSHHPACFGLRARSPLDAGAASCSVLTSGNGASGEHGQRLGQHRYLTTCQAASWLPPGEEDCWTRRAAASVCAILPSHDIYIGVLGTLWL